MTHFNLTKKNKFILFLSLFTFLIVLFIFFTNNSMHKSIKVGQSKQNGTNFVVSDMDNTLSNVSPKKDSKPLFVSKTEEEKVKETSIIVLLFLLLGLGIYAISAKDNYKKHHDTK